MKIEYKIVVFLYAYLHQIDLSLDRSRWTSLVELNEYYKTQIAPEKVAYYLIKEFDLEIEKIHNIYYIQNCNTFDKIRDYFLLNFSKKSYLKKEELYYCCQKLFILNQYLTNNMVIHKLEIEKLRIDFAKFTYCSLQSKVFSKDRNKAINIEHFLQNKNLNVISIEEFTDGLHF